MPRIRRYLCQSKVEDINLAESARDLAEVLSE
jgi:hypothetical protein